MVFISMLTKNSAPRLSIVTISYNQKEFLHECIESILSQLHEADQYIVVDPGSTDGSRELVSSYGDSIVQVFEQDRGPADGLNHGFSVASNEFLYFLNADDVLIDGALNLMREAIIRHRSTDVFCFGGYLVDRRLEHLRPMRCFGFTARRMMNCSTTVFQQGVVLKKAHFDLVGGFNANNNTCWDAELFFRLSLAGCSFRDMPEMISLFRLHENSITGSAQNFVENRRNKDRLFFELFSRYPNRWDRLYMRLNGFRKYFHIPYTVEYAILRIRRNMNNSK